jgi:shikimate kinase
VRGHGRGAGGISILNGLFTGEGAAAGVELFAHAEVELTLRPEGGPHAEPPLKPATLAQATADAAASMWSSDRWQTTVTVRSEVPPGCGLKSSSAVATAVEHAVLAALGTWAPPVEVARLGARVARDGGFSATGAFDDALASVLPGIHLTDNRQLRPVSWSPTPDGAEVVLWVPPGRHRPSPEYREVFSNERAAAEAARDAARAGRWAEAMGRNSELVQRIMQYDVDGLREAVVRAGAISSGVSGMGPAVATVTRRSELGAVLRALPSGTGQVVVTRFLRAPTGGPA